MRSNGPRRPPTSEKAGSAPENFIEDVTEHGSVLPLDDEHDHRELRMVGDARDAVVRRLKFNALTEFGRSAPSSERSTFIVQSPFASNPPRPRS